EQALGTCEPARCGVLAAAGGTHVDGAGVAVVAVGVRLTTRRERAGGRRRGWSRRGAHRGGGLGCRRRGGRQRRRRGRGGGLDRRRAGRGGDRWAGGRGERGGRGRRLRDAGGEGVRRPGGDGDRWGVEAVEGEGDRIVEDRVQDDAARPFLRRVPRREGHADAGLRRQVARHPVVVVTGDLQRRRRARLQVDDRRIDRDAGE